MTRGPTQTLQPYPTPRANPAESSSPTSPLLLWLGIQLIALLVALLRIPLAAQYPQPAELLAAQVMVVVQVTSIALLFPYLLRDLAAAVAVAATAVPFILLGGALSAVPAVRMAGAGSYVSAWIVALWAWNAQVSVTGRLTGVAAAALLTGGTLVALYLRLEYALGVAGDAEDVMTAWAPLSPPLAALHLLTDTPRLRDWCAPAVVLAAALASRIITRRSSQVIHSL